MHTQALEIRKEHEISVKVTDTCKMLILFHVKRPFLKLITHLSVLVFKQLTEEVNDVDGRGVCLLMNLKRCSRGTFRIASCLKTMDGKCSRSNGAAMKNGADGRDR